MHGSKYHRQRLVVERDDDGRRRQVLGPGVVGGQADGGPGVGQVPVRGSQIAASDVDVVA